MGGRDTEVDGRRPRTSSSRRPTSIRRVRGARAALAGLSTDASYRFERGVDVALAPRALERVAQLVIALAGGSVPSMRPSTCTRATRRLAPLCCARTRLQRVLGVALACAADRDAAARASAASRRGGRRCRRTRRAAGWRHDLVAEVDLVEEVARLHGYEQLPDEIRPYRPGTSTDAPLWTTAARLREALAGARPARSAPIPFVAGGDGTCACSIRSPRTRRICGARCSSRSLGARSTTSRTCRATSGSTRSGPRSRPVPTSLPDETVRVALLVMGDRDPAHFAGAPATLTMRGTRRRSPSAWRGSRFRRRPFRYEPANDADGVLWQVLIGGEHRGEVRSRAARRAGLGEAGVRSRDRARRDVERRRGTGRRARSRCGDYCVAPLLREAYRPLPITPASEFDLALLVPDGSDGGRGGAGHPIRRGRSAGAAGRVRSSTRARASKPGIGRSRGG